MLCEKLKLWMCKKSNVLRKCLDCVKPGTKKSLKKTICSTYLFYK